jgi:hypothetical protein
MRAKDRELQTKDMVIGFLLVGPFYYILEKDLRKRSHNLTKFEQYGILLAGFVALVLIAGSIVTNYGNFPL